MLKAQLYGANRSQRNLKFSLISSPWLRLKTSPECSPVSFYPCPPSSNVKQRINDTRGHSGDVFERTTHPIQFRAASNETREGTEQSCQRQCRHGSQYESALRRSRLIWPHCSRRHHPRPAARGHVLLMC